MTDDHQEAAAPYQQLLPQADGAKPAAPLDQKRRKLLGGLTLAAGGLGVCDLWPTSGRAAGNDVPVVETASGKVSGMLTDGVQIFHGIPYADTTAGANRFMPPKPPASWSGVREALALGASSPQFKDAPSPLSDWYGSIEPISEDCLSLNVFAPASHASTARRAVMVWFHGGAWGSCASTAPGFDATALARDGDVVVVSVNHRLNVFGYLYLGDQDVRFADAGNAGVLDMVASLQWVKANIAQFGGNPDNVTIFGQSGGASKVTALMDAPAAAGLFHRAIVQSCSGGLRLDSQTEAAQQTDLLLKALGMSSLDPEALQKVPMDQLMTAMKSVKDPFRPLVDGRTFTRHPFDPDAPSGAAAVPLLIGNAATEMTLYMAVDSHNFDLSEAVVKARLARIFKIEGSAAAAIYEAYRTTLPGSASATDVLTAVGTDYVFRRNTTRVALLQSAQAPVYDYVFDWQTPVMKGVLRSPHTVEVPFVFGSTEAAAGLIGRGPDIAPLCRNVMGAWSAFARTGNPNGAGLPNWPRYEAGQRATMMLSSNSHVENDPGGAARKSIASISAYEYSVDRNMLVRDS